MYKVTNNFIHLLYCRWFQSLETNTNTYPDGLYHVHIVPAQNRVFLFPAHWIYFHFSWGRHYYTITISALLGSTGGVQSGIMMAVSFVQQLVCSLNAAVEPVRYKYTLSASSYRCVRDHSKYKRTSLRSTLLGNLYIYLYIFPHISAWLNGVALVQQKLKLIALTALTLSQKEEESSNHSNSYGCAY